jgi:hypothetical protein
VNSEIFGPMELNKVTQKIASATNRMVTVGPKHGFREGTELPVVKNYFVFASAGMGDFICYMPAILWVAKNCPWIDGGIFCPRFFVDFAKNVLRDFPAWDVLPAEEIDTLLKGKNVVLTGPGLMVNGRTNQQLANGTGGHLTDVGFLYFANLFPTPPGADRFPELDLSDETFEHLLDDNYIQPKKYVVFTPGAVSDNRTVPGHYWNPIIDEVIRLGLEPVFLGKTNMSANLKVRFPDGCDYHKGVDLRDKTSMLEAAYIMKNAVATLGFDNGLIHLAACTDATIIAGYGSVNPRERRPNREHGLWTELFPHQLECAGCQTNMKRMFPHNFKYCLYKRVADDGKVSQDVQCIDILFRDDGHLWIQALHKYKPPIPF